MAIASRPLTDADQTIAAERCFGAIEALDALPDDAGPEFGNAFAAEMRTFLREELQFCDADAEPSARLQGMTGRMLTYALLSQHGLVQTEARALLTAAQAALPRAISIDQVDVVFQRHSLNDNDPAALARRLLCGSLDVMLPELSPAALNSLVETAPVPQRRCWAAMQLVRRRDGDSLRHLKMVVDQATDDQMRAEAALQLGHLSSGGDRVPLFRNAAEWALYGQTRAVAMVMLGTLEDGNIVARFREALRLAQDLQTRAKASLELGFLGDGKRLDRFVYAMEHARQAETKARAMVGLALMHRPIFRVGYLQPALQLAQGKATQMLIHTLLAELGDGDVNEHRRLANQLMASTSKLERVSQLRSIYRAFPDLLRLLPLG